MTHTASPRAGTLAEAAEVAALVLAMLGDRGRRDPRATRLDEGGGDRVKVHDARLKSLEGLKGELRHRRGRSSYQYLGRALTQHGIKRVATGVYK